LVIVSTTGTKNCCGTPKRVRGQHILEAVISFWSDALAGAPGRPEIFLHQRLDLIVRDRRHPRVWWPGPPGHRVDDQCQRTAGLQHVVDRLGRPLLVGPVEGLAEGHQPVRPRRGRGQVLGQALDPPDVHDCFFLGCAAALREHADVRVQTDRLPEQMSEADDKQARAAADIQKPAVSTQTRLLRQDSLQLW
jgi:hypothetical protein